MLSLLAGLPASSVYVALLASPFPHESLTSMNKQYVLREAIYCVYICVRNVPKRPYHTVSMSVDLCMFVCVCMCVCVCVWV